MANLGQQNHLQNDGIGRNMPGIRYNKLAALKRIGDIWSDSTRFPNLICHRSGEALWDLNFCQQWG